MGKNKLLKPSQRKQKLSKSKPADKDAARYYHHKLVSQKEMDEAVNSGMICLENWEVIK